MAATRETHTTRTHETTRRSYTNDEASAFLEASTLSNRAMTARRLFRFADALDDATRARSRCETYDAFSRERPSVRVELLSIKIACAQADALVNLGRAWDACGVLRSALRRLARSVQRTSAEGPMDPEEKRVEQPEQAAQACSCIRHRFPSEPPPVEERRRPRCLVAWGGGAQPSR